MLVDLWNAHQARIPHPLASDTQSTSAPAADTQPVEGKVAPLSADQQAQLEAQRLANTQGRPRDSRHVQTLDTGRTESDKVYRNADGTTSIERSAQATSYKDAQGAWRDVDNTLVQDTTTGKWQSKANSWQARFGATTGSGVELSKGTQTLKAPAFWRFDLFVT